MATTAYVGPGFLLQKGDGAAPENFTTVPGVKDLSGAPEVTTDTTDITNQSSSGGFEEIVTGIIRSGQLTFTLIYNPSDPTHDGTTGLYADTKNKTLRNFRVTIPGSAIKVSLSGYVVGFKNTMPVNGPMTVDVTIKITGVPTIA